MTPRPAVSGGALAARNLNAFLSEQVRNGTIPGAVWVVARRDLRLAQGEVGCRQLQPRRLPARLSTLYDLASLTKPLVTAALAVLLVRERLVSLEEPLAERLPEFAGSPYARCTLKDLLLHCAGLPAWEPLYLHARGAGPQLRRMARLPPVGGAGEHVVYSDLGYMAAGSLLERAAGRSLDQLFASRIRRHLGEAGKDLRFCPPRYLHPRAAPTELGNHHERAMVLSRASPGSARYEGWRDTLIRGEVHDQNAWARGGVSGHAGLFGSAPAVAALGREFLSGSRLFQQADLALFETSFTPGLEEERSVGFQRVTDESPGAGLSPAAFGHVGFTGTSLFLDPETAGVFVLLTNRVHPHCREVDMKRLRRSFHRLAAPLLSRCEGGS